MAISEQIKKVFIALLLIIPTLYISGCAEINLMNTPKELMKHPLGTDPIRVGMTKDAVVNLWGQPDQINQLQSADEWQTPKEEWVYIGRYSKVPIDRSYLFKTKYLVFDGKNLVSFGEESQSKVVEEEEIEIVEE